MARNLIYSYWISRPCLPGAEAGAAAMSAYAKMVGADFRFDRHDPYMGRYDCDPRWFDKLRPCYDPSFAKYDKVLVVDSDVFPVDGITANIFDEPVGDFGMCEEPDQPEFRERFPSSLFSRKADEQWVVFVEKSYGCKIPHDDKGRPRTWNAGVILFTQDGLDSVPMLKVQPKDYVRAAKGAGLPAGYATEQAYMNMLAFSGWFTFTPLSVEWNRQVHFIGPPAKDGTRKVYDRRNPDTKFTHIQLTAADHRPAEWQHEVANSHRK